MSNEFGRLSGWFRALLCVVLLIVCGLLAWWSVEQNTLRFQVADVTISLDTSRQRERKQQYEYNEVSSALPKAQAELEELSPKAEAAVAAVTELKAQRKELRARKASLEEALSTTQAEVDSINTQITELTETIAALRKQVEALSAQKAQLTGE